jgi:hypothetical protein
MTTTLAAGLVLAAGTVGAFAGAGPRTHAVSASRCGTLTVRLPGARTYRFAIRVTHGRLACAHARRVMRRFLGRSATTPGWACFRGHGGDAWAAACASTGGRSKTVRAYERDYKPYAYG